jgi:hypothetical protein
MGKDFMKKLIIKLLAVSLVSTAFLAAEEWKALWDGKSLEGWHVAGKGTWTIEDGAIRGIQEKSEPEYGHLISDAIFGDFTVRLKFKALKGNSGFYFRVSKEGFSGVTGFQAEIDATKDVGGLYETNGRGWVVQPSAKDVGIWFKPGEWNEMKVTAKGGDVTVHINGKKSAGISDDPGRKEGHFALQLHGKDDVEVWFKEIEILQP